MASFFGNMFDQTKPGPGVPKDEPQKPGIVRFFTVYFRKFWKIVSLNAFYFIAAIPAFVILYFVGTYFLYGPISAMLPGVNEGADALAVVKIILMYAMGVTVVIGIGPFTAGMTHILRDMSREQHAWVLSDFWQYTKENWKQGLATYLINLLVLLLGMTNLVFYAYQPQSLQFTIFLSIVIVILTVFALMQPYVYTLMVTFDMKLGKLYKNAFLLTVIRLPQNLLVYLAGMAFVLLLLVLMDFFPQALVVMPFFIFTTPWLMFVFNSFSVTKKFMIDEKGEQNE